MCLQIEGARLGGKGHIGEIQFVRCQLFQVKCCIDFGLVGRAADRDIERLEVQPQHILPHGQREDGAVSNRRDLGMEVVCPLGRKRAPEIGRERPGGDLAATDRQHAASVIGDRQINIRPTLEEGLQHRRQYRIECTTALQRNLDGSVCGLTHAGVEIDDRHPLHGGSGLTLPVRKRTAALYREPESRLIRKPEKAGDNAAPGLLGLGVKRQRLGIGIVLNGERRAGSCLAEITDRGLTFDARTREGRAGISRKRLLLAG